MSRLQPSLSFEQLFEITYFQHRKVKLTEDSRPVERVEHLQRALVDKDHTLSAKAKQELDAYQTALYAARETLRETLRISREARIFNTDEALVIKKPWEPFIDYTLARGSPTPPPTYVPDFDAMTRLKDLLLEITY